MMDNATLALCAAYMLPGLVALLRRARGRWGIVVLNALLGWTVLGWIAALVWVAAAPSEARPAGPGLWR